MEELCIIMEPLTFFRKARILWRYDVILKVVANNQIHKFLIMVDLVNWNEMNKASCSPTYLELAMDTILGSNC